MSELNNTLNTVAKPVFKAKNSHDQGGLLKVQGQTPVVKQVAVAVDPATLRAIAEGLNNWRKSGGLLGRMQES